MSDRLSWMIAGGLAYASAGLAVAEFGLMMIPPARRPRVSRFSLLVVAALWPLVALLWTVNTWRRR